MRDKYIESLKVSVCLVKFKKKDGSLRKMYCTLKEDMMNFPDSPLKKVLTESPTKNIVVWDIENKGWRSFWLNLLRRMKVVMITTSLVRSLSQKVSL